jgi:L-amino acid N-acyltransferase YncA
MHFVNRQDWSRNFNLSYAIAHSPKLKLTILLGFIFAHNQPSLNLFKRHGFSQWAIYLMLL